MCTLSLLHLFPLFLQRPHLLPEGFILRSQAFQLCRQFHSLSVCPVELISQLMDLFHVLVCFILCGQIISPEPVLLLLGDFALKFRHLYAIVIHPVHDRIRKFRLSTDHSLLCLVLLPDKFCDEPHPMLIIRIIIRLCDGRLFCLIRLGRYFIGHIVWIISGTCWDFWSPVFFLVRLWIFRRTTPPPLRRKHDLIFAALRLRRTYLRCSGCLFCLLFRETLISFVHLSSSCSRSPFLQLQPFLCPGSSLRFLPPCFFRQPLASVSLHAL